MSSQKKIQNQKLPNQNRKTRHALNPLKNRATGIENEKADNKLLNNNSNKKKPSKLYETFRIIDYTSYTNIHNKIHKKIAKYYGKTIYKYKDAVQILKDFLENEYKGDLKTRTKKKELTKEDKEKALLNSLIVFSINDKKKQIKKYTEEKNSWNNYRK